MNSTKSRLAGIVAVSALAVLAFAASAHAALQSGFFIGGAQAGSLLATFGGKQLGRKTLLVPALKIEINCDKFTVLNGAVESTSLAEGQFLYEECTILTNEGVKLEETICQIVVNHLGDNRHHITATALLLPAEMADGSPAILAEKIVAKVLTREGEGCILPKTTEIRGELCLKLDNNHKIEPELLASQAIQETCRPRTALESLEEKAVPEGGVKDKLLFGVNEAFVDGKADIFLTGVHASKTLGVLLI